MRPIDADKLFRWGEHHLSDAVKYGNKSMEQASWSYSKLMMYEIAQEIEDAPTIDPKDLQPHGHWIEHPTGGLVCSHCDRYKPDEWRSMCCPNCGAILDGQVECDG